MPTKSSSKKEEEAKAPAAERPGPADVHEQRERGQPREGVVSQGRSTPRPTRRSPSRSRARQA